MPYKDRHGRTCGFLDFEMNENSQHFVRRYFIVNRHKNMLYYYMDNPQNLPPRTQPTGWIELSYISMVNEASHARPKLRFAFFITVAGERKYFLANDKNDCMGWVSAIKEATKIIVPNSAPSSPVRTSILPPVLPVPQCCTDVTEKNTGYKAGVYGGVVVKTPMEVTKTPVCLNTSSEENYMQSQFYVLRNNTADYSDSDSDYDSSCDEALGRCHTPKGINFHGATIKAGYCIKQGMKVKTWKKRYFVLDDEGVAYYKSHLEKFPIRIIPMADIIEARVSIGIHLNREHLFEVVTANRVFYVQPLSVEQRNSWIAAINFCLERNSRPKRQEIETKGIYNRTPREKDILHRHSSILP